MDPPLFNTRLFGPTLRVLEDIASPMLVQRACEAVGLPREVVDGTPVFLPYRLQARLGETVARHLGEAHLGALVGSRMRYEALGLYADYVLAAPHLLAAMERGRRALRFIMRGTFVDLVPHGAHLRLRYHSGIQGAVGARHIDESMPFVLTDVVRRFAGDDWRPAWIELPGSRPSIAAELEDLYGAPIVFGAEAPAIAIAPQDLAAINPRPRAARAAIVREDLRDLVRARPPETMAGLVRDMVRARLVAGDASAEAVAAALGLGLRTIQRRLRTEGTAFREIHAAVLSERAAALLAETEHSLEEIADALGYEEVNSFRRAFQAWRGVSPSAFRAEVG